MPWPNDPLTIGAETKSEAEWIADILQRMTTAMPPPPPELQERIDLRLTQYLNGEILTVDQRRFNLKIAVPAAQGDDWPAVIEALDSGLTEIAPPGPEEQPQL